MKNYSIAILFLLGIICQVAYKLMGSQVSANGVLIEPFYLIPLGWTFFLLGVFLIIGKLILRIKEISFNKIS